MKDKQALIIFAREPIEGQVKTRLVKDLNAPFVTRLYEAFIQDVIDMATTVEYCDKFLYYADQEANPPFIGQFADQFTIRQQMGVDLGSRMAAAVSSRLHDDCGKIVIIGTDCLEMTSADIDAAFKALDGHDYCLGPSKDGGYYLIGMKQCPAELFAGVKWGTSSVYEKTLANMTRMNQNVWLLPEREDIDNLAALAHFAERMDQLKHAAHARQILIQAPEFRDITNRAS